MNTPEISPKDIHATVTLMSSAAFFSGAALRICDALLPRLAHDFNRTPGTAGQVIISFAIAYGLMQLFFGPIGDRYGKAHVMCLALFGCALSALTSALVPGFEALVWTRAAWGMAAAGVIPLAMAWIGDNVPYDQRQATLARFLTGTLSGMMAGQLTGGLFADSAWGWRGAFAGLTVGYSVVAVLLMMKIRAVPSASLVKGKFNFVGQLGFVLAVPWARVVLLTALAEGVFLLGPLSYLPAYLHLRHGLSLSASSALIALYAVGGLVYAFTARRIVARYGEHRMVLSGGILMGLGFLILWLSPWWLTAGPDALMLGFGTYLFHNTLQTNATQMAPAARGTSVALFAFCLFGGQAIGVSLAGYTFDHFGATPMLLAAAVVLPLAGWWFMRALLRRQVT